MRTPTLTFVTLVFVLLSACGRNDECRAAAQACGQTADCCDGLICMANACVAPTAARCGDGRCDAGENGQTCCRDCGCAAAGQVCQANLCVDRNSTVCGNGKCDAGETQGSCCTDCGCAAGQSCQANQCKAATGTTLQWTVTNRCFNGENIEFIFFSQARRWQWPGGGLVFVSEPGSTHTQPLACNAGEKICLGADQPGHGLFWGVDIDGSAPCSGCCLTCANQSVDMGPLTCP